jgi:hypothetical protein
LGSYSQYRYKSDQPASSKLDERACGLGNDGTERRSQVSTQGFHQPFIRPLSLLLRQRLYVRKKDKADQAHNDNHEPINMEKQNPRLAYGKNAEDDDPH